MVAAAGTPLTPDLQLWASERFDRAVLILGDLTEPLRPFTHCWAAVDRFTRAPRGLAVRFEGFATPTASLVADDLVAVEGLLHMVGQAGPVLMAVHSAQPLPASLERSVSTIDPWMTTPCAEQPGTREPEGVEALQDAKELSSFYRDQEMGFWLPAMLSYGHAFGVRGPDGRLIAAGGTNFVIPRLSYAQIGALATHRDWRGHAHGTRVLAAIRRSLARAGISSCGLFADAADARLPAFYAHRGFVHRGNFRFIPCAGARGKRAFRRR